MKADKNEILFLSSGKAEDFANQVRQNLDDRIKYDGRFEFDCLEWNNPDIFPKGDSILDSLLNYANNVRRKNSLEHYAVCVFYPDDLLFRDGQFKNKPFRLIKKRDYCYVPRDNVIFELGLFYSAMGKRRTFFLYCDSANDIPFHLPTDLGKSTVEFSYKWDNSHNKPEEGEAHRLAEDLFKVIAKTALEEAEETNPEETSQSDYYDQNTAPEAERFYRDNPKKEAPFPRRLNYGIPPR